MLFDLSLFLPTWHLFIETKHSCFQPTNHSAVDTSCCPLDNCGWKQPPTFSPWDVVAPSCSLLTILHGESRLGACQYASNIYCLTHGLWGEIGRHGAGGGGGRLITPIHLTASSSPDPSANTTRNNVLFKETSAAVNRHRRTAYYELQNTHSRGAR